MQMSNDIRLNRLKVIYPNIGYHFRDSYWEQYDYANS